MQPISLVLLFPIALGSLLFVLSVRRAERELVGDIVGMAVPARAPRHVATGAIAVLGALAVPSGGAGLVWALLSLAAVLAVNELRPSAGDRICGSRGVRRGFSVRSFEELEEWRLIGDHLRFRLYGEWTAVPVPAAARDPLLGRLRELAGDRESVFNQ